MQTDSIKRRQLVTNGSYVGVNLPLNLTIFKIKPNVSESNSYKEDQLDKVADASSSYLAQRSISTRLHLDPGMYVIMPSTFEKGQESKFLLRCFTEGGNTSKIIKYKNVINEKAEDILEKLPDNKATKLADKAYHKAQENLINPAGAVVSRACSLM